MLGIFDNFFGIGEMTGEVFFGLKLVALVMLYGYMHMNLGGGILSTVVFAIFGYYLLFYLEGIFALIILVLFYLMLHGFDIIWGGDIAKGQIAERKAMKEQMMQHGPQQAGMAGGSPMMHPMSPQMRGRMRPPPI